MEDICVRWVCKNILFITEKVTCSEPKRRWRIKDFWISARPAQKILLQLCKRNILDDEMLHLFTPEYVDLISPSIKEANIGHYALRILRDFRLLNLSATNLERVNLNTIIGCLGEWTVRNLKSLNISGTSVLCETNLPIVVPLGRFKSLHILNVSRTEFTTQCLQIVVNDLPNLRHLNVSRTRVVDISALVLIADRLTGLIMHRLDLSEPQHVDNLLSNIIKLHELRHLDASDKPRGLYNRQPAVDRLCSGICLPYLTHIDLSGNQFGLRLEDVMSLMYAGFASWNQNQERVLNGIYQLSLQHPDITMLGDRGDALLLATLTRNKDRAVYLQNAFHSIFEATNTVGSVKSDLLAAVIRVMRLHLRRAEMILAGTAVIYNLTRGEQSNHLAPNLLNRAVRITLAAMEKFPSHRQLQKNCFLTLCNDIVLHRAVGIFIPAFLRNCLKSFLKIFPSTSIGNCYSYNIHHILASYVFS
ncbi:unnamed protein product [Protopolystoma xenopodis]|uniref:Uncharacterized protein n=1 Tax=Protopolystoma xenopodis TaxID=117903 RepID=A0A3S5B4M2_9PLAT|nr:unnamed protein product [Protopolystoma xenopodis]